MKLFDSKGRQGRVAFLVYHGKRAVTKEIKQVIDCGRLAVRIGTGDGSQRRSPAVNGSSKKFFRAGSWG
jgi:hypothetical protein